MLVAYIQLKWLRQDIKEPIQLDYMSENQVILPSDSHVKCLHKEPRCISAFMSIVHLHGGYYGNRYPWRHKSL